MNDRQSTRGSVTTRDELVEKAAFELYAGGPWGDFIGFVQQGAHAITDAHTMDVYREMVRTVLGVLQARDTSREEVVGPDPCPPPPVDELDF